MHSSPSGLKKLATSIALGTMLTGCASSLTDGFDRIGLGETIDFPQSEITFIERPGRAGPLSERELDMARIAWRYFENNYNPRTGFVNAVDNYPSTTLWDTSSYLGALMAAKELDIIDSLEFSQRMITLLKTLNSMELYRSEVPNKAYHAETGEKVDYANKPGEIGYSALDIGRLMIWLKIIKERFPEFGDAIDNAVLRWNFCKIVDEHGTLYGARGQQGEPAKYVQEGRLGYEEYAAKGFQLWGFDTYQASRPDPYDVISLYGVDVPYDSRDPREHPSHNYVVTESYALDGIELNWDLAEDKFSPDNIHSNTWMADFAQRIYKTQERRYHQTGILTARTEHQLADDPYFVYDTIYTDGYAWNTITESGKYVPEYAAISTKGAIGLWVLWDTPYTDLLFNTVADLYHPDKGFYEGKFENGKGLINTFTANNNGVILEALWFKQEGKLLKHNGRESKWDKVVANDFQGQYKCLPRNTL